MNTINLDDEIKMCDLQIAAWQGKRDLLMTLKQSGAVVTVPATVESPEIVQPEADNAGD